MKTRFVVAGLFLLVLSRSAFATTITPDGSWLAFQFDAGGAAEGCFGGCVATTNPLASDALAPPWTFSGPATVTVLDLFLSGDTFELFDNLVSLGVSSLPTDDGECGNGCPNDEQRLAAPAALPPEPAEPVHVGSVSTIARR